MLVSSWLPRIRDSIPSTSALIDGQLMYTDEFGTTRVLSDAEAQEHLAELEEHEDPSNIPRKTYRQLINPWSGTTPNGRRVVRAYIHMAEAFTSPGLIYALLVATIVLGCAIGISLTYNAVLQENYGWPAANIGLINVSTSFFQPLQTTYLYFSRGSAQYLPVSQQCSTLVI